MKIRVIVLLAYMAPNGSRNSYVIYDSRKPFSTGQEEEIYRDYVMDHDDPSERHVLGEQCRNAFEAGQCIVTFPVKA
jgi:hypothetical protein